MSDTESKQSKQESAAKNDVSESNAKSTNDNELTNMSSSTAHNTYANLSKYTEPFKKNNSKKVEQDNNFQTKRNRNNKPPNPQNGSCLIVFIVKDILSFEL